MSTVDLGGSSGGSSNFILIPVSEGVAVSVNKSYMLGVLTNTISVDDVGCDIGSFIELVSDYTNREKTATFSHPVVIGNTLHETGSLPFSGKITLWFDGMAWTDNFNSTVPLIDHGLFEYTASGTVRFSELSGMPRKQPLFITLAICGGGGLGATDYSDTGYNEYALNHGGSGASSFKCDFVLLDGEADPVFDFTIGAVRGGHSSISMNDIVLCAQVRGGLVSGVTPAPSATNVDKMLRVELCQGANGGHTPQGGIHGGRLTADDGIHRGQTPGDNSAGGGRTHYYNGGGASAMSDLDSGFGRGGRRGADPQAGGFVLTIRPATADEITAQEALNV